VVHSPNKSQIYSDISLDVIDLLAVVVMFENFVKLNAKLFSNLFIIELIKILVLTLFCCLSALTKLLF